MIGRSYLFLASVWRRALFLADVGFVGFWLGILGRAGLHEVDDALYRQRRNYREDEHNLRGLFDWEEDVVKRHFSRCRRLLVLGAGGGREVISLARMGYEVAGFECNRLLVEAARDILARAGVDRSASVAWLARDAAPESSERFNGVIVGWSAYMLIFGRQRRIRFLDGLRAQVAADGPLLISFFTRSGDSPRLRAIARVANAIRRLLRRPLVEVGDDLAPNYLHRFTADEVEAELRESGFRLLEFRPEGPGPYDSGYAVARSASQREALPLGVEATGGAAADRPAHPREDDRPALPVIHSPLS
jgi:hypothetical protein